MNLYIEASNQKGNVSILQNLFKINFDKKILETQKRSSSFGRILKLLRMLYLTSCYSTSFDYKIFTYQNLGPILLTPLAPKSNVLIVIINAEENFWQKIKMFYTSNSWFQLLGNVNVHKSECQNHCFANCWKIPKKEHV